MVLKKKIYSLFFMLFWVATSSANSGKIVPIKDLSAHAYDAHVELTWNNEHNFTYEVFVSIDTAKTFSPIGETSGNSFIWFLKEDDRHKPIRFRVVPYGLSVYNNKAHLFQVKTVTNAFTNDELLGMVQKYTTRYFDEFAQPHSGMARERSNNTRGDIVTTGGTGFGIMALIAGAERNYLTRERAFTLVRKMVNFLDKVERFHGAWAHWYNGCTGEVAPFSAYDDGGDLVETAFLVQGLLTARSYFSANTEAEISLRNDITRLWEGVNWNWYTQDSDSLYWHWSKNHGFKMNHRIKGYDETLITYILAASSPTFPISPSVYHSSYTNSSYFKNGKSYYGIPLSLGMDYGGPLFFAHYSFLGLNPNGLNDVYADYFERNRAHVLIHKAYAIDNPLNHKGYSDVCWGLTASDDPILGYAAHAPGEASDNGTISPTAAIASIVYAPEATLPAIRHFYYNLGTDIFGEYGFYDAFNLNLPKGQQVVKSYLAIDQGPIAVMIENYRSQLVWNLFMANNEIYNGLTRIGFYYDKPSDEVRLGDKHTGSN